MSRQVANEIQQPKPFDLVGNPILVGGIGSGFEAVLQFRIHDGHDERTGHFTVGGGTGEPSQAAASASGMLFRPLPTARSDPAPAPNEHHASEQVALDQQNVELTRVGLVDPAKDQRVLDR
jgi:hypothetical protein